MKRLIRPILLSALIFLISGCQKNLFTPKEPTIDKNLPVVSEVKYISDMTEIAFEWTSVKSERVQGYYIYRSNPEAKDKQLKRIATIDDRYASHYVDDKLQPETVYYYTFSTFTKEDAESLASKKYSVKTRPLIESVSFIKAISNLPNRVKLIWRPHPHERIAGYIVEKNEIKSLKWKKIKEVRGRLNAEYIDKDIKNSNVYRYRVKVKTYDGIVSKPSEVVEARAKPLPLEVSGLRATNDIYRKIELNWMANNEKDIIYYKVYRAMTPYLFYNYLAKTKDTKFEDLLDGDGVARYYKITVVDKDGLESAKQQNPVMGSTLGKPKSPIIKRANISKEGATLEWADADDRAVSYVVVRKSKDGWKTKEDIFKKIKEKRFFDSGIMPGEKYTYEVFSVDRYGIESKPSEDIVLLAPKSDIN